MSSGWWCRSVALCGWLLSAGAQAQQGGGASASAEAADEGMARGLFQAGKAAYEAGRYEQALGYFEQAYEQSKRPRMLYNIGQAADRLRRDERALEAFREFLRLLPDDPVREEVDKRIAALERAVAERKQAEHSEQAAPAPPIVTPAAAAQTVAPPSSADAVDSSFDEPGVDRDDDGGLLTKWWLWTSVGVVLAGGVTVLVLVLDDDAAPAPRPIAGDVGGVVQTLGRF